MNYSKYTSLLISISFMLSTLLFAFTIGDKPEKLELLDSPVEISKCIEFSTSEGDCGSLDTCPGCETSGSNFCCQKAYTKCYYWLAEED